VIWNPQAALVGPDPRYLCRLDCRSADARGSPDVNAGMRESEGRSVRGK
jgi:hypothetical protein